ncbi:cysteine desulfurase family protein [Vibrio quintilis]|uniref:cysteine desulfurase n=1 Tax=Vibrio quintilis TaxID=1117707 RepID=A0A1M7YVN8_9VIBR|nr:cysteine desulfurase family protein [Vibrio quintilis]SHO56623.1 Cysteine desulfurase [Vibrio quintilis]
MNGYFDFNATTPVSPGVQQAVSEAFGLFGNPSSRYSLSSPVQTLISETRKKVAQFLCCTPEEIIFTSGGTESNNLAVRGVLDQYEPDQLCRQHVICSAIEHPSMIELLRCYERRHGLKVSFINPDAEGRITLSSVENEIISETCLITLMAVNNETGVIQPVGPVAKLAQAHGIHFHVDAVQAVGKIPLDLSELGAQTVAFSGHKFYAPKGIGGLYCQTSCRLLPLFAGGGQENGMRSGTENTVGIAALKAAVEECESWRDEKLKQFAELRSLALSLIHQHGLSARVIGASNPEYQAPWTLNLSLSGIRGESLATRLDLCHGICVSLGSACSNNKEKRHSHVLKAMGIPEQQIDGAIRISFGYATTESDVKHLVDSIAKEVGFLLSISPAKTQENEELSHVY